MKKVLTLQPQQVDNPSPKKPNTGNQYAKYGSLAFQTVIIIIGFVYLGQWIDGFHDLKMPLGTLVCTLGGAGIGLYTLIKGLQS